MARVSEVAMKKFAIFLVLVTLALPAVRRYPNRLGLSFQWSPGRYTDLVPGEDFCFLLNGAEAIPNDDTITPSTC